MITGYTLILIIDKVLFDTHSLFADEHGHGGADGHGVGNENPAEEKFRQNLKASFMKMEQAQKSNDPAVVRQSMIQEGDNIN
jgi:hypothetical protein